MNKRNPTEQYKWIFCLLLLVWISQTSTSPLLDDSTEYFNDDDDDASSEKIVDANIRTDDLHERQEALKNVEHKHVEHATHAEINKGNEKEQNFKPSLKSIKDYKNERNYLQLSELVKNDEDQRSSKSYQNLKTYSREDSNEDELEFEYNPWEDSFQDIFEDGSYAYGYSLPNGVTRYERSFYSEKYKGLVVQGFYTQPRAFGNRKEYELRCYHADYFSGFRLQKVQYIRRPPIVRRDEVPDVDCLDKQ